MFINCVKSSGVLDRLAGIEFWKVQWDKVDTGGGEGETACPPVS